MVELFLNSQKLPVNNFIFHHSERINAGHCYKLTISLEEVNIIDAIEKYASCKLNDPSLENEVIRKDKLNKSMGLLWRLKVGYLDKITSNETSETFPILYNIEKIRLEDVFVIIEGKASSE